MIFNYPAVIFGLVQYMLPFAVLLIVPAMAAISEDVELASEGLGARLGRPPSGTWCCRWRAPD